MSRSSKPNWAAYPTAETGVYNVLDADGSGRAYKVRLSMGGRVFSAYNFTHGRTARLNPDGPTAKMLASVIRAQCASAMK